MKSAVIKIPIGRILTLLFAASAFVLVCALACVAGERLVPIYSVNTPEKAVSLTFDCAWEDSDLPEISQILSDCSIPATFFVTGEFAESYPESLKVLHSGGHEIANHSDTHPHVARLSKQQISDDADRCSEKIKKATGAYPQVYRAPYGEYNNTVLTATDLPVIQWDCDSRDWQEGANTESITRNIMQNIKSGSILLFHVDSKPQATAAALRSLIPALKDAGYQFKRVSDLIYKDNYTVDRFGVMNPK